MRERGAGLRFGWLLPGLLLLADGCGGGSSTPRTTPEEQAIGEFVLARFEDARGAIDPMDTSAASVRFLASHVEVVSARWCYCLDVTGRQILRPAAVSSHVAPSLSEDLGTGYAAWLAAPVSSKQVEDARGLAGDAFGVDDLAGSGVSVQAYREVILSRSADRPDETRYHRGRTTVLFSPSVVSAQPWTTAVVFGHDGAPLRIETLQATPAVASEAQALQEAVAQGRIRFRNPNDPSVRLGTFSDTWAARFELSAWSYEGEEFITTTEPATNPYSPAGGEEYCNDLPYPLGWYRTTEPFLYWTWNRWDEAGRLGGARGNFDVGSDTWELPGVHLAHHHLLGDYAISGGTPPTLEGKTYCGGKTYEGWRLVHVSTGNRFEPAFFDDLEDCHVAVILSHGGPLPVPGTTDWPVQFGTDQDYWAYLHRPEDPGLGGDRLRYLLFGTCASMNWHNAPPAPGGGLPGDWMNFHVADGLRMACGHDGELNSSDHDGYTFFSFYNDGDTVTDSWHLASMKYTTTNYPVTVAYGSTLAEVVATLFDQRFQTARAGTGWILAVASYPVPVTP